MSAQIKNLVGQTFGRLTVLKDYDRDTDGSVLWLCQCECGNKKTFRGSQLKRGEVLSCGCYRREQSRVYNTFETHGDVTYVYDNKHNKALIDTKNIEKVRPYYWFSDTNGYFVSVTGRKHKTRLTMHELILGKKPKGLDIDHINRNKNDNREVNLRYATRAENNINKSLSKHNTSGYTGVSRMANGRFRAYITVDGKQVGLGVYDSPEQAYKARLQAEKKYYGSFSTKGGDE